MSLLTEKSCVHTMIGEVKERRGSKGQACESRDMKCSEGQEGNRVVMDAVKSREQAQLQGLKDKTRTDGQSSNKE